MTNVSWPGSTMTTCPIHHSSSGSVYLPCSSRMAPSYDLIMLYVALFESNDLMEIQHFVNAWNFALKFSLVLWETTLVSRDRVQVFYVFSFTVAFYLRMLPQHWLFPCERGGIQWLTHLRYDLFEPSAHSLSLGDCKLTKTEITHFFWKEEEICQSFVQMWGSCVGLI